MKFLPTFGDTTIGTSFHGSTFRGSYNDLVRILGVPPQQETNDGKDKTNFYWSCNLVNDNQKDIFFTVYDWKEYRRIKPDEIIKWHIGGFSEKETDEISELLHMCLFVFLLTKSLYEK